MKDSIDHGLSSKQNVCMTIEERRAHNDTAQMNSLPNELLACIFDVGFRMEVEDASTAPAPKETIHVPPRIPAALDLPAMVGPSEVAEKSQDREAAKERTHSSDQTPERSEIEANRSNNGDPGCSGLGLGSSQGLGPNYQGIQVAVSHVCARWRECALATPNLWTYIDLSEGPPYEKSQEWLIRSKSMPLKINAAFTRPLDDPDEHPGDYKPKQLDLVRALNIIVPHIDRWREVDFHSQYFSLVFLLIQKMRDETAPKLERLVLHNIVESGQSIWPAKLPSGPQAVPNLSTLSLTSVYVNWHNTFLGGTNLTTLKLAYHPHRYRLSIQQLEPILKLSPNLEELILVDAGPSREPWWGVVIDGQARWHTVEPSQWTIRAQPILMPHLKKLSLSTFEDVNHLNNIIELIHAPGLLSLILRDLDPNTSDFTDTIWAITSSHGPSHDTSWEEVQSALLSPRYPGLEELSISCIPLVPLIAYSCLFYSLRSLKRLSIVEEYHSPPLASGLTQQEAATYCFLEPSSKRHALSDIEDQHRWLEQEFGTPCPLLEEFHLPGADAVLLTAVARRRDEIGRRLQKMVFNAKDGHTEKELNDLCVLVDKLVEREKL